MATAKNKRVSWLERVKAKAVYNFEKRQRQAAEDAEFKRRMETEGAFEEPADDLDTTQQHEGSKKGKK